MVFILPIIQAAAASSIIASQRSLAVGYHLLTQNKPTHHPSYSEMFLTSSDPTFTEDYGDRRWMAATLKEDKPQEPLTFDSSSWTGR